MDRTPKASESNDFLREIWGADRVFLSAGGYTPEQAVRTVAEKGGLVAFGRYFISNVRCVVSISFCVFEASILNVDICWRDFCVPYSLIFLSAYDMGSRSDRTSVQSSTTPARLSDTWIMLSQKSLKTPLQHIATPSRRNTGEGSTELSRVCTQCYNLNSEVTSAPRGLSLKPLMLLSFAIPKLDVSKQSLMIRTHSICETDALSSARGSHTPSCLEVFNVFRPFEYVEIRRSKELK